MDDLAKLEASSEPDDSGSSYTERLISSAINNIQISIKNVYFRFTDRLDDSEDDKLLAEKYALGMKFKSLSVMTTDENYED